MAFELVPQRFWSFPLNNWDEDEDLSPMASTPSGLSLSEDEKHIYVEAAVPGIDPKDVDITFDKGMLWVKTNKKEEEKNKKYYRRAATFFSYRVAIPGDLDMTIEPEAHYKNGVMHITFAKSPKSQPKKITIKSSK